MTLFLGKCGKIKKSKTLHQHKAITIYRPVVSGTLTTGLHFNDCQLFMTYDLQTALSTQIYDRV